MVGARGSASVPVVPPRFLWFRLGSGGPGGSGGSASVPVVPVVPVVPRARDDPRDHGLCPWFRLGSCSFASVPVVPPRFRWFRLGSGVGSGGSARAVMNFKLGEAGAAISADANAAFGWFRRFRLGSGGSTSVPEVPVVPVVVSEKW
jgi:hypothetical protein